MIAIRIGQKEYAFAEQGMSALAERVGREKTLSDEFDAIIVGEKTGDADALGNVIDFGMVEYSVKDGKMTLRGRTLRRMCFPIYTVACPEKGKLRCEQGICVTVLAPFFVVFLCCAAVLSGVIIALVLIVECLGVVLYNLQKTREEIAEIDLLMAKIME